MSDQFLWVEKYRPKTIEECILPDNTKKTFQDFLDKGEIPNMLLLPLVAAALPECRRRVPPFRGSESLES